VQALKMVQAEKIVQVAEWIQIRKWYRSKGCRLKCDLCRSNKGCRLQKWKKVNMLKK
jgi:hypothetical protein